MGPADELIDQYRELYAGEDDSSLPISESLIY